MAMKIDVACHTDMGSGKRVNQDSACAMTAVMRGRPVCMLALCDGMGGASMGEYASRRVIREFAGWFEYELPQFAVHEFSLSQISSAWVEKLIMLDREFRGYREEHGRKLGTTATCMLFWQGEYLLVQSGDSRAYQIRSRAVQLSEDQSYVQQQVKLGVLTKKEARNHPRRNVLTDCIGGSRPSVPVVAIGRMKRGAVYLLCSDGLIHEASNMEFACRLAPWKCSQALDLHEGLVQLTEAVRRRGETDDITAAGMLAAKAFFGKKAVGSAEKAPFLLMEKLIIFDGNAGVGETAGEETDGGRENVYTTD